MYIQTYSTLYTCGRNKIQCHTCEPLRQKRNRQMNIYLTLLPEFPVKTTPFSFFQPPHASNRHRSTTDILIYADLLQ
ncbi:hypothetical protein HanPSC8_Chr02g0071281 [Helianthus annuus]|nr:hypothetical protein HanPSC8_Chr02g0071281 [Helianthus annuus]